MFQSRTEIREEFDKGSGDSQTESFSLSGHAAAVEVHLDVVLTFNLCDLEGLGDHILEGSQREIFLVIAFVNRDLAAAFFHVNSGNCGFSSSDCISDFHFSYLISLMLINFGC